MLNSELSSDCGDLKCTHNHSEDFSSEGKKVSSNNSGSSLLKPRLFSETYNSQNAFEQPAPQAVRKVMNSQQVSYPKLDLNIIKLPKISSVCMQKQN
jgi:hypothetical protein